MTCRAYAVEDRVFARRQQRAGIVRARELADKLCAHFGVDPIHVRHTHRQHPHRPAGSWFWYGTAEKPPRISVDLDAPEHVVCHEVAHYVAWVRQREGMIRERGHGREWAAIYVEAVRVVIPGRYADRLERGMVAAGVMSEATS